MTHDELKATINNLFDKGFDAEIKNAMLAVVELHKPIDNPNFPDSDKWCWQCAEGRGYAKYPCPTIQAITEQLG